MAAKFGRMVTYLERHLAMKLHELFFTWSFEITWQIKTITFPLPQCLWPPNPARWWCLDVLLSKKTDDPFITWPLEIMCQFETINRYLEKLQVIKSHELSTKWSCKITWQTKTIIPPLLQNLSPPNVEGTLLPWESVT